MQRYYSEKLSAERLKLCYEIAPPRVKQYLEAEIEFALEKISQTDLVLELGCGYGRVLQKLVKKAKIIFGIDTSRASLSLAQKIIGKIPSLHLSVMNAVELGFSGRSFDTVICVQNGISAFKVNKRNLIEEATRVTRSGGTVLFSSYSERFWENRLEWFRLQSEYGLIGEIDDDASKDGIIVCKDGFMSDTIGPDEFISLTSSYGTKPIVTEVDGSSIFCEIRVG